MPKLPPATLGSSLFLALTLSLLLVAPGWAADDGPWSVTLKVGQTSVDAEFDRDVFGWRVDDEETSTGLAVGYSPSRFFGFELAYQDLGSYRGLPRPCEVCILETDLEIYILAHPESVDFTGVSLAVVPRWPVTEHFEIFGKIGALDWRGDVTPFLESQNIDDPSGTDVLAGLGVRLGVNRALGLQLEYETTDLYDHVSLGASWRF